jgi:hypothetical protein
MDAFEGKLKVLNWNIAGAKYLDLKSVRIHPELEESLAREYFRERLNLALTEKINEQHPHVITLQEVVKYSDIGDDSKAECILDVPDDYRLFFEPLIDTKHYSAPRKWNQVIKRGEWSKNAFFAQGNAIFIRKDVPTFPIFELPKVDVPGAPIPPEVVKLTAGFYFGDRNTEPRAALITHIVLSDIKRDEIGRGHKGPSEKLDKPLDIFIVNVHLTTIKREREGIPDVDQEASRIRMRQIDIITNEVVSRYNNWVKDKYAIEGMKLGDNETTERHKPIWVLAGDFNFTTESDEYRSLLNRGFIDLLPLHAVGTKASGLGETPTLTVDYVFGGPKYEALDPGYVREGIKANRVAFDEEVTISDHLPILITVPMVLPKKGAR